MQGDQLSLDKRKATILRAVVREFVRTGQPVGSKTLAQKYRLKVSAATIRNDMGLLEELGYIAQPYTSAGRIPTDRGYRWFVDHWQGVWPELPKDQKQAIDGVFDHEFRDMEEALTTTSQVLSDVTAATAVVSGPPPRRNLLRRLELFGRSDGRCTILLVADTGVVEHGVVDVGVVSEQDLSDEATRLNALLEGVAFEELADRIRNIKPVTKRLSKIVSEVERLTHLKTAERIFRGGTANILAADKFADIATAHDVVGALEQTPIVSSLLETARRSNAVLVFIGREVPVEQMQTCAVVLAPFGSGSERQGTLGVVGPTRMDYPHTISAVEAVARSLSRMLDSVE